MTDELGNHDGTMNSQLADIVSLQGGLIAMLLDILMDTGHLPEDLLRDRMSALYDANSEKPLALREIDEISRILRLKHRGAL